MSAIEQIATLIESLSFAEKLSLNERIATTIRKEGGGAAGKKRGPKAKTADGEAKPKRKAALGTLAWTAYVKHMKTTDPDAFEGITKESDKLIIVKGMRSEDPEGYKTFTEAWKEEHKDDASNAASEAASEAEEEAEEEETPAPAPVSKAAAPKAAAPKAAAKTAAAAPKAAAPKAAAPAAKTPAPKAAAAAAAAEPKAKAAPAAKKAVKAVAKAAKAEPVEEPGMDIKEIDGVSYWHDPESNGLWEKTGETTVDGTGSWVGYFQSGNDEEPIRFTESFGDE
jgi:hypothetical protein